jgi:hypothetical protein
METKYQDKINIFIRKEINMSEIYEEKKHPKKETSGAWVLLLFVGLLTSIIVVAMVTR